MIELPYADEVLYNFNTNLPTEINIEENLPILDKASSNDDYCKRK